MRHARSLRRNATSNATSRLEGLLTRFFSQGQGDFFLCNQREARDAFLVRFGVGGRNRKNGHSRSRPAPVPPARAAVQCATPDRYAVTVGGCTISYCDYLGYDPDQRLVAFDVALRRNDRAWKKSP
jgi:D-lactate dehydrogenase